MELMLDKNVRLKENYGDYLAGCVGICTADLRRYESNNNDIFAVKFSDVWATFKGEDVYKKFEIVI